MTTTAAATGEAPGTACLAPPGLLGSAVLPGRPTSVGIARAFVRTLLRVAGCQRVDDALLLVSELVTNAVQHSDSRLHRQGQVSVTVVDAGDAIRIDVTDDGSDGTVPVLDETADPDGEGGRGLWLVDRLANRWGVREHPAPAEPRRETDADRRRPGRSVVWFEIARRPDCR